MVNKPGFASSLLIVLMLGALAASIFGIWTLSNTVDQAQDRKYDLALIQDARYGILNVHEWKRQVSVIISKKIEEFDINPANEGRLKEQVQTALYKLIDELGKFLKKEEGEGSMLEKMLKSVAYGVAFDAEKFKQQVPEWSEQILLEIDNEETRKELKDYIGEKIEELLQMTEEEENTAVIDAVSEKYGCIDHAACSTLLSEENRKAQRKTERWGVLTVACILLMFFFFLIGKPMQSKRLPYFLLIAACLLLLYGGLSLPMIDIDARITDLNFNLMGEEIVFSNQVLFFQSKSILQVVTLLLEQGDFQTVGVGFLILLFSVIFPILKMTASAMVVGRSDLLSRNKLLNWLVLKSGKWSMADVFVVAIFMAYIGFKGIINSQLTQLERNQSVNMITTHEFTALQIGFLMFMCFCLASLLFSSVVQRRGILLDEE